MHTYTFKNGLTVTGTIEQIKQVGQTFGEVPQIGALYNSSTHGLVPIRTMDTTHIRNALLKKMRNWVDDLKSVSDKEVLQATQFFSLDTEFVELRKEFNTRINVEYKRSEDNDLKTRIRNFYR